MEVMHCDCFLLFKNFRRFGLFRVDLGAVRRPLGAVLEHLGATWEVSWGLLGRPGESLGVSWSGLEPLGAILGHLGAILE